MWAARCRVVHPNGTRGLPSRKKASDEGESELNRSELKEMPITRRFYVGTASIKANAPARTL